jgi:hypothetical protein
MNEKYGNEITRDQIEKMLLEATGFKGDTAALDAVFVVIETWAAQMAEGLSAAPSVVREAHLHLLVQQAELLLDSGGRLAMASQLSENVIFLAGLTEGMSQRIDGIDDRAKAADEITRMTEGWDDQPEIAPWELEIIEKPTADEVVTPVLTEPERDILADWEAELLAGKLPTVADVMPKRRAKAPAIENTPAGPMLQCTGCGQKKKANAENFFRNSKSSTGFESRCRTCRSARAA